MDSINSHPLYGRRLTNDSLAQISRDVFVHLRRASTNEIENAIKVIQGRDATEKTTCSTLSTVLCLLTRPNELSRLRNTGMLSACVSLLRTYGNQTSGKLFSYEYGHLCYQLLTIIFGVGVLLHTRRFEVFAQQASQFPDPFAIYLMLASKAIKTVEDGFKKRETRATRDWLFGISGWGPDRVFLPEVGGFRNKDITMLLDLMWQDQDTFSKICINTPTAGWSLALFAIESHLQLDILDHAGERPDIWNTFARLVTLGFRYSLIARGQESDVVQDVYIRSHFAMVRFVGEYYHRPPFVSLVDLLDAKTVVEAYIRRGTPAFGETPLFIEVVIASIPLIFGEALHELPNLIPPLFNSILSRLWAEIVDEEPSSTFEDNWQVKTAHYTVCVLKSIESVV
ncbi:hypothetical protein BDV93DRAFT_354344 [Ceratobasidium sp. AG-I]|nr:hypothetical protein BDV93DRAFT_354344 [Ceratobasidium sp. AG-I]